MDWLMTFEEWNDVLARRFFNSGQAGKRVYLHTTKELLVELSSSNTGVDDFIAVIKLGPAQIRNGEMCSRAIAVAKNWRASGVQYPPYIAYLCLFALAASHDGDWPRHALLEPCNISIASEFTHSLAEFCFRHQECSRKQISFRLLNTITKTVIN